MVTLEEWLNGDFRKYPEFSTQEGYYKAVRELIEKYGEKTKKDMLLVRSGNNEHETGNYGASWTTDVNVCRMLAKRFLVKNIYVVFVPKGTMAIHLHGKEYFTGKGVITEEEYVLDMEGKKGNVMTYAEHRGEFDWRSDWETDEDFYNWHLVKSTGLVLSKFYKPLIKGLFCRTEAA